MGLTSCDKANANSSASGTAEGNGTQLNVFEEPVTAQAMAIDVMLDGPYENDALDGRKIATIDISAGSNNGVGRYTVDVSDAVDGLDR